MPWQSWIRAGRGYSICLGLQVQAQLLALPWIYGIKAVQPHYSIEPGAWVASHPVYNTVKDITHHDAKVTIEHHPSDTPQMNFLPRILHIVQNIKWAICTRFAPHHPLQPSSRSKLFSTLLAWLMLCRGRLKADVMCPYPAHLCFTAFVSTSGPCNLSITPLYAHRYHKNP